MQSHHVAQRISREYLLAMADSGTQHPDSKSADKVEPSGETGPQVGSAETLDDNSSELALPPEPARHSRPPKGDDGKHLPHGSVWALSFGALGVVYGDIGTSPLYAMTECFHGAGITPEPGNVLGILSLFFWALTLVVTVKYLAIVTRADNHGEGGILSLLALVLPKRITKTSGLILAGLFGAALLYADGMLTPAISVLSAVEGLGEIDYLRGMDRRAIVGISVAILVSLFMAQRGGTKRIGAFFGPVMLVWFLTIAVIGIYWIARHPFVLTAVSPHYAVMFFVHHKLAGFLVLGSVVLCITGGEALYADMGHFGRRPIAIAWLWCAFPCLLLNYFGQGALLLDHPEAAHRIFYNMVSGPFLRTYLVIIATAATVVASQALISGAFSLTRQAIQLGYMPRLGIRHTSSETEGQIYIPEVNWILMLACVALVIGFQRASAMAAAYGIAVTGTMAITTVLFYLVAKKWWGAAAFWLCLVILIIDLAFFGANLVKLTHGPGGWVPLIAALLILATMTTWKLGRDRVAKFLKNRSSDLDDFLREVDKADPHRVEGTAVFMTSSPNGTPPVLLHHYKHNRVLHKQVVLLSIITEDRPFVGHADRVQIEGLREGFFRLTAHYGYMQTPDVIRILRAAEHLGLHTVADTTSFYLGREKLVVTHNAGMSYWRKLLFSGLSKNARPASDFFKIPPDRVVEIGMQLEL